MAKKIHSLQLDGEPIEDFYYYYHNWTAGQKNMIHKGHCGDCKFGLGKKGKQIRGEHGAWVGPFETADLAIAYVKKRLVMLPSPELHDCCE